MEFVNPHGSFCQFTSQFAIFGGVVAGATAWSWPSDNSDWEFYFFRRDNFVTSKDPAKEESYTHLEIAISFRRLDLDDTTH